MTTNSISRNGSMTMKAVRLVERGGAEKVMYTEAPRPHIAAGEALVRICASAITPTELTWSSTWTTKSGQDRLPSTLGHEFAGFVEDQLAADRGRDVPGGCGSECRVGGSERPSRERAEEDERTPRRGSAS